MWSQAPVVGDSSLHFGPTLRALLGMPPTRPPPPQVVARHLVWLAARHDPKALKALHGAKPLDRVLDRVYRALGDACYFGAASGAGESGLTPVTAAEARAVVTEALRGTPAVLRLLVPPPLRFSAGRSSISSSSMLLSSSSQQSQPEFVHGSTVFAYLPLPLAPLALHTRECHKCLHTAFLNTLDSSSSSSSSSSFLSGDMAGATALAKCLGVRFEPPPSEVLGWVDAVAALADRSAPLSPASPPGALPPALLRLACNALLTLARLEPSEALASALASASAPNSRAQLVPAASLVVPDAPWLDGRVDDSKLNIAHELLLADANAGAFRERERERERGMFVHHPLAAPWPCLLSFSQVYPSLGSARSDLFFFPEPALSSGVGASTVKSAASFAPQSLVQLLKVRRLSEVVEERLAPGFAPEVRTFGGTGAEQKWT